jgi:RNA polymerase sigma-70 factor, ECF subfamily
MPVLREEHDITGTLHELSEGDPEALERLMPLVYEELQRIAHSHLLGERSEHTLSTTALVHEAYLKLVNLRAVQWKHRAHFFAVCARLMRQILVDYARTRGRDKRGGELLRVPLAEASDVPVVSPTNLSDLIDLDDALTRLERENERLCRVVECRCLAGLSVEETAEVLGISEATVKRDWTYARAVLNRELGVRRERQKDGAA